MHISEDLKLQLSQLVVANTAKKSAFLSALSLTPIETGKTTVLFEGGESVAAFVEEGSTIPTNTNKIVRKELAPKTVSEIITASAQAYNANAANELMLASDKFSDSFAKLIDKTIITGTGAPTGFGNLSTSATVEWDNVASIRESLGLVSQYDTPLAIILSEAAFWQINPSDTDKGVAINANGEVAFIGGVPVFRTAARDVVGAVIGANALRLGANLTDVSVSREATVGGDNLFEKNAVGIRMIAEMGAVLLDARRAVVLTDGSASA